MGYLLKLWLDGEFGKVFQVVLRGGCERTESGVILEIGCEVRTVSLGSTN